MSGKRALFVAMAAGASAGLYSALMPMAWRDSAHVAMRYARRISDDGTLTLLGQSSPVEAFINPLWTATLSVLGMLDVHELRVQPFLGPVLFTLVVSVSVFWVSERRRGLGSIAFTALMAASPVLALAARSGTDALFVALLVLSSAWGCARAARWAILPLVGLTLCGVLPLLIAVGLAATHSRRALVWVGAAAAGLTVLRLMIFDALLPHAGLRLFQGLELSGLLSAVQLVPLSLSLGLVGLAVLWRNDDAVWPLAWPLGVGVTGAAVLAPGAHDFAEILVPIIPLMGVAAALGLPLLPRPVLVLSVAGLAVLGVDLRAASDSRDAVIGARQAEREQAQSMAKFLRWRFAEGATVVVQTPGMLPYFLRMPTIDLQGLTHDGPVDRASMQALDPEVMVPMGEIVASQPTRLAMSKDWDWKQLAETHVQHAIMQSRDWELVPAHPTWFNLYMRESLPKYPPKWVEIYEREEAARAEAKKRSEDEGSAR